MSICPVTQEIKDEVNHHLSRIEMEKRVSILWAVESGSRAWGFWRPSSDYDVRYIYVHEDVDRYMSPWIEGKRDIIGPNVVEELDLDMMGWDLRKFVQHLAKSNPNVLEWLHSPIEYSHALGWVAEARYIAKKVFNPKPAYFHYSSIARNAIIKAHNTGKKILKRQLYAIRCVLAARWLMNNKTMPPMDVTELIFAEMPEQFIGEATGTILQRKVGQKSDDHWFSARLIAWVEQQILELRAECAPEPTSQEKGLVEQFFIDQVKHYGN